MTADTPFKCRADKLGPRVANALKSRHFDAYYCSSKQEAVQKALELIPHNALVSWGGSATLEETGLLEAVKARYNVLDRDTAQTPEERRELMRRALLCNVFLMSANAVTEDGQLVNVDGNGNRVAALVYGPKSVIVVAGVNKVTKTLADAVQRARTVAAPMNAQRFADIQTPCGVTGACADCISPDSICAYLLTTRISRPAGKIKVILVGETLGF